MEEIRAVLTGVDFWHWFALGAVLLLKGFFRAKIPWWLLLVLIGIYSGLTHVVLTGEGLGAGVALLALGAAYVLGWPLLWMIFFVSPDPYFDQKRAQAQKKISKLQADLESSFEISPVGGSFFALRLLYRAVPALDLIDERGNIIQNPAMYLMRSNKGGAYRELLVRGYWDCSACGTTRLTGTYHNCRNCDRPIQKSDAFYIPADRKRIIAFTKSEAHELAKQPEWICDSCSRMNRYLQKQCAGCGSLRPKSPRFSEGVANMPAALAQKWQQLWQLEAYFSSIPFDTAIRSKNAFYFWAKAFLVLAVIYLGPKLWRFFAAIPLPAPAEADLVNDVDLPNALVAWGLLSLLWLYFHWLFLQRPFAALGRKVKLPPLLLSFVGFLVFWAAMIFVPIAGLCLLLMLFILYCAEVWLYVRNPPNNSLSNPKSYTDSVVDFFLSFWFLPLLKMAGLGDKKGVS